VVFKQSLEGKAAERPNDLAKAADKGEMDARCDYSKLTFPRIAPRLTKAKAMSVLMSLQGEKA
jgi:hypothetical protein